MGLLDTLTNAVGLDGRTTSADDTALHQKVHEAYVKMQAQKAMQAQQAYGVGWTDPHSIYHQQPAFATQSTINLNEGAWDVPVSQLVDLWTVRFGSKWVKTEELDEFYSVAVTRLNKLNKIETHYVNGNNVYRIVE